jgi:hypothetical protein
VPLDAEQLKQQAAEEVSGIKAEIEGLRGERAVIDEKIAAAEVRRKESERILSALTPRAKRGEGKKAQAKKAAAAQHMVPSPEPGPTAPGAPTADQALQAQVAASGTQPVGPFIPPAS